MAPDLSQVLRMAEASIDRERAAVQELRDTRQEAELAKARRKAKWNAKTQQLRDKEHELVRNLTSKQQKAAQDNALLRRQLEESQFHCGQLRDRVAHLLKGQNQKEEAWQDRLQQLQDGVQALIASTAEAIKSNEGRLADTSSCADCVQKSHEIDNLRSQLKQANDMVHGKLAEHSDFVAATRKRHDAFEENTTAELERLKTLATKADQAHAQGEKIAAQRLENLQAQLRVLEEQRAQSTAVTADRDEMIDNHVRTTSMLRQLLEAERTAFADFRERTNLELNHLRAQLATETQTADSERSLLQSSLQVAKQEAAALEAERALLKERIASLENDDLAALVESRQRLTDKVLEDHQDLQLHHQESGHAVLLAELRTLRAAQARHNAEVEALNRDKDWLRRERDAVAQGFVRQQTCVQDQLHVVAQLKDALEQANAEKAILIEDSQKSLNEIKDSLVR